MDLEGLLLPGQRGRHVRSQLGKCHVIFNDRPNMSFSDSLLDEWGRPWDGGCAKKPCDPESFDYGAQLAGYGGVKPYEPLPEPFQRPSQWLPAATFEPISPRPLEQPSFLDAPKSFEPTRFQEPSPYCQPLKLASEPHGMKLFGGLPEEPEYPLMRLDYGNPRRNEPEHLQYGVQHTKKYRENDLIGAREVFSETLAATRRPLFSGTTERDIFGNPLEEKDAWKWKKDLWKKIDGGV